MCDIKHEEWDDVIGLEQVPLDMYEVFLRLFGISRWKICLNCSSISFLLFLSSKEKSSCKLMAILIPYVRHKTQRMG